MWSVYLGLMERGLALLAALLAREDVLWRVDLLVGEWLLSGSSQCPDLYAVAVVRMPKMNTHQDGHNQIDSE